MSRDAKVAKLEHSPDPCPEAVMSAVTIDSLPDEMLIKIFCHLPLVDLAHGSQVCTRWRDLVSGTKAVWRDKVFVCFGTENSELVSLLAGLMPRLSQVCFVNSIMTAVRIAWPEVTVFVCFEVGPCVVDLYPVAFDADTLVITGLLGLFPMTSVNLQTLRRIVVLRLLHEVDNVHCAQMHHRGCHYNNGRFRVSDVVTSITFNLYKESDGQMLWKQNWKLDNGCRERTAGYGAGVAITSVVRWMDRCLPPHWTSISIENVSVCTWKDALHKCPALENVSLICTHWGLEYVRTVLNPCAALVACVGCGRKDCVPPEHVCSCRLPVEHLDMINCDHQSQNVLTYLQHLKNLRSLRMTGCPFEGSDVASFLADLPRLKFVMVDGQKIVYDNI